MTSNLLLSGEEWSGPERRRSPRQAWRDCPAARFLIKPHFSPRPATTLNVSLGGVGLIMAQPPSVATVLAVLLRRWWAECPLPVWVATVVHTTERPGGTWVVGCRFHTPLLPEDLQALL